MIEPRRGIDTGRGVQGRYIYRVSTIDDTNLPICRYARAWISRAHARVCVCACVYARARIHRIVYVEAYGHIHAHTRTYTHGETHVRAARSHTCVKLHTWVGISDIYGQYFRFSCCYRSPYQFNMSAIKNWIKLYPHLATVSTR